MGEKADTEPCGPAPNAAEPLSSGQHGKQSMVRVEGVSGNIPSLGHAALVLNGEEMNQVPMIFSAVLTTLYLPPVGGFRASTPHGDAAGQEALYGAPVECSEDGRVQEGSPHPLQQVQRLLCLLDQCRSVHRPGEVVCDVHPQELGTGDHLHSRVVDEKWSVAGLLLPEVDNDLFCFVHVQGQVDFATPAD